MGEIDWWCVSWFEVGGCGVDYECVGGKIGWWLMWVEVV